MNFATSPPRMAVRAADPASLHRLTGRSMGTGWSVLLNNPRFLPLDAARRAVQEALDLVVAQMSHWEPGSGLCRFGRAAAGWHALAPEFFTVLTCALDWAEKSGGAFDPTVAPLVAAWGFGPQAQALAALPDAECLRQLQARTGWQRIELRAHSREAFQPGGVQLDLGAIAKGYAVDLVCQRLRDLGQRDFLVELGGEVRAVGRRCAHTPWRVALAPGGRSIALQNQAIATSGDLYQRLEVTGRQHSHSIDPRSGRPIAHNLCSVSVLHTSCMQADALATVLTVLGPQAGLAFAECHHIAALLCQRTPDGLMQAMTRAFAGQLPG